MKKGAFFPHPFGVQTPGKANLQQSDTQHWSNIEPCSFFWTDVRGGEGLL